MNPRGLTVAWFFHHLPWGQGMTVTLRSQFVVFLAAAISEGSEERKGGKMGPSFHKS